MRSRGQGYEARRRCEHAPLEGRGRETGQLGKVAWVGDAGFSGLQKES
jgi:hypothetical protein